MTATQTNSKDKGTADLLARLAQLEAENARLKAKATKAISMKVSEKKALSLYGMGRFPVTLYRGQWERLFAMVDDIKAFIETHKSELAVKED